MTVIIFDWKICSYANSSLLVSFFDKFRLRKSEANALKEKVKSDSNRTMHKLTDEEEQDCRSYFVINSLHFNTAQALPNCDWSKGQRGDNRVCLQHRFIYCGKHGLCVKLRIICNINPKTHFLMLKLSVALISSSKRQLQTKRKSFWIIRAKRP